MKNYLILFLMMLSASVTAFAGEVAFDDVATPSDTLASDAEAAIPFGLPDSLTAHSTMPIIDGQPAFYAFGRAEENHSRVSATSFKKKFFSMESNPGVKPYRFMDDMTFVGVPLFIAGIAIKGEKASFRQNYNDELHPNTRLITKFKTKIDDYTQYFGPAMTVGLKLGGYEGRSTWPRLLATAAMSYGTMAILVNSIKYTASEMRPDGSTANSWPSGHTATSFVGATILHKEYGLTRSPWFSVLGYGVATATGVMRVLNNRHWVSDVLSGAGIGILSGELGYALSDVFFKGRGLLRNDLLHENEKPSFFSISMGVGLGGKSMEFGPKDLRYELDQYDFATNFKMKAKFRAATTVDAEGAYFFNKYVGVGGRFRVRAMSIKSWSDFVEQSRQSKISLINDLAFIIRATNPTMSDAEYEAKIASLRGNLAGIVKSEQVNIVSDHLTEFSASVGMFFNLPLSKRFSLGTKALIGRSMTQELDINAQFSGDIKDVGYVMEVTDGQPTRLDITHCNSTGETYNLEWDYITLGGNNTTTFGTGLSLTYRYKSNFLWKVFVDYDYTRKDYTLTYDPYRHLKYATPDLESLYYALGTSMEPYEFIIKKDTHFFTIGASFAVNF